MGTSVSFVNRWQLTIETGAHGSLDALSLHVDLCIWNLSKVCKYWVEEKSSHIFLFASAKDAKEKEPSKRSHQPFYFCVGVLYYLQLFYHIFFSLVKSFFSI